MKQVLLLFSCIALVSFTGNPGKDIISVPPTIPTAGVYLYSNGITTAAGNAANGHEDEIPLANDSSEVIIDVVSPTQISPPGFSDFFIKKAFDITSLRLSYLTVNPTAKTFEIRYYNGVSPFPVYKVVLLTSFISSYSRVKVDCQGSACIGIQEIYSIKCFSIQYHNLMVNPPQILTYNMQTQTSTWTNN